MVEKTEHWTPTPTHGTAVVARTAITEPASLPSAEVTADPVDVHPRTRLPRGLQRIGRYHVLKQLGEGGMGVVYSAFDEELDRRIAVKVLAADISVEFAGRTRLMREAQAMAKVSHPNVVHVYEVGEVEGHIFVAMEFVRGVTLREWLDRGGHSLAERLELMLQAGEGLAAAHASDIVHRDFKPENAMVGDDGRVRVLDFGLARSTGDADDEGVDVRNTERTLDSFLPDRAGSVLSAQLTRHGSIMGTPAYMSPEQHFGTATDARSDQFNFCVVLYEALYGERPFSGDNRLALAFAVRQGQIDPAPPRSEVPQKLREILLRGLRAEPGERFASMNALLAALRAVTAPPRRRPAWLVASGALALAAAAAGAAVMLRPQSTEAAPSAVQNLASDARLWASRAHWVYPDAGEPDHTALRAVGSLRALEDETDGPGDLEADGLSREFADTLARLGDDYWDAEGGRVFARDFYVQALLFDPTIARARERSGVLAGEIADLRERAQTGGFTTEELAAAAELAELAAPVLASAEQTPPPERLASVMTSVRERAAKRRRERSHIAAESAPVAAPAPATVVAAATPAAEPDPAVAPPTDAIVEVPIDTGDATDDGELGAAAAVKDPKLAREQAKDLVAQAKKLKSQGKREAALQKLFDATRVDRRYAPAFDALRDLHFQVGAYVEAVQYGEKAVKLSPGNGSYLLRLGEAQFKSKDYDAAERSWRAASALGLAQADDRLAALGRTGSR